MPKITPFLCFDNKAEEAANFYASTFKDSTVLSVTSGPDGESMAAAFRIDGQEFLAVNGCPVTAFTEAISFMIQVETQEEIDELWEKLSEGGEKLPCGWLKDKYGLAWQVDPVQIGEWLSDQDPEKSKRVMDAVLKMGKLEIETLKKAYEGSA
ncbi:MAG: VOC family protein [Candidatus Omnitrophota bacterium]